MNGAWTIKDELEYIDSIGTHYEGCKQIGRKEMLRKYLKALHRRTLWPNLNRRQIQIYVVKAMKATR